MALHTMAALPSGWIWGHLYPATATEILKFINQKMGGVVWAKAGFSPFDSVLKVDPLSPNHMSEEVDEHLGFLLVWALGSKRP